MTFAEQAVHDPALRAFIAAEIGRAHVRLQSLEVENEHQRAVIADQKRKIADLEAAARAKGKK